MNGYDVKSMAIIAGISAVHRELSKPHVVASYAADYHYGPREAESALMGIAQEITYPMWIDWQAIQEKNKLNSRV